MKRVSDYAKGFFVGVLVCGILETIDVLVFAFLTSRGIMHLEGWIGAITYFAPLVAIFIISGSVGLAIARQSHDFKKVTTFISVIMALILGSNYVYFWWWWNHNVQYYIPLDANY
jgi:hypothetical protein